jgi:hypothetical protein
MSLVRDVGFVRLARLGGLLRASGSFGDNCESRVRVDAVRHGLRRPAWSGCDERTTPHLR